MKTTNPSQIAAAYECPSCDWEHWFSSKQLNHPKFIAVCDCGEMFKPAKVGIDKTHREAGPLIQEDITRDKSAFINALSIVSAQGFDDKKLAKITPQEGSEEELIKYIIKSYPN